MLMMMMMTARMRTWLDRWGRGVPSASICAPWCCAASSRCSGIDCKCTSCRTLSRRRAPHCLVVVDLLPLLLKLKTNCILQLNFAKYSCGVTWLTRGEVATQAVVVVVFELQLNWDQWRWWCRCWRCLCWCWCWRECWWHCCCCWRWWCWWCLWGLLQRVEFVLYVLDVEYGHGARHDDHTVARRATSECECRWRWRWWWRWRRRF